MHCSAIVHTSNKIKNNLHIPILSSSLATPIRSLLPSGICSEGTRNGSGDVSIRQWSKNSVKQKSILRRGQNPCQKVATNPAETGEINIMFKQQGKVLIQTEEENCTTTSNNIIHIEDDPKGHQHTFTTYIQWKHYPQNHKTTIGKIVKLCWNVGM